MAPREQDTWVGLSTETLSADDATRWATRPECGAVVVFSGTARDHSPGRSGVRRLSYEAYEAQAVPRLADLAREMRRRWPAVVRVALLHRVGEVPVGDAAVVVAVSSAHRDAAFDAARFGIDALKATVPIWKHEEWDGGSSWGLEAQHVTDVSAVPGGER